MARPQRIEYPSVWEGKRIKVLKYPTISKVINQKTDNSRPDPSSSRRLDAMRPMKNTKLLLLAALLLPPVLTACGKEQMLSADPVDATLVDADTGEPLAGVPVVAYWEVKAGSLAGDSLPCGAASVEEAVTDKDGKFHIPGWGPVKGSCGYMRQLDPQFYAFKSGYKPLVFMNEPRGPVEAEHSVSDWNGKTVKMHKDPDTNLKDIGADSYEARFDEFNISLEIFIVDMPGQCNWKKIPNMLRALSEQQKLFNAAGTPNGSIASELITVDQSMQIDAPQCGSPKAFVGDLEKRIDK